jgi:NADPH:quinone reductase-like Zn-dependent oxidoreductase
MESMKAVRMHEYGGPEVLKYEEAPRPEARAGEALVKVHAAGVNPADWKSRQGYFQEWLILTLPAILGSDFSGVVEEVGPGIDHLKPGDEIYGRTNPVRGGAYAEYAAVQESAVALKPTTIDHVHAAGVPVAALTAWQALLDTGVLKSGQRVLIHGAAGGVGISAVQLAKWKGAYVIGTASERNRDFLQELGADEVVDYQTTPFEEAVSDVDLVLDTLGGDTQERSWQVLKKGGMLVSIVSKPLETRAKEFGVRTGFLQGQANAAQLTQIARLVDSGHFKTIVETVLPLDEARKAHEISQGGHTRGKIVLKVV